MVKEMEEVKKVEEVKEAEEVEEVEETLISSWLLSQKSVPALILIATESHDLRLDFASTRGRAFGLISINKL